MKKRAIFKKEILTFHILTYIRLLRSLKAGEVYLDVDKLKTNSSHQTKGYEFDIVLSVTPSFKSKIYFPTLNGSIRITAIQMSQN